MQEDQASRTHRSRWVAYVAALVAGVLVAMSAVAFAQDGTTTDTTTDTTEETTPPAAEPEIPEGFSRDDCEFTEQPDGSTSVTCTREEQTTTSESDTVEGDATVTTEVRPIGGTAAGAGGTATEDESRLPFVLGGVGLALALTAAVLARRRRLE
jgi:hypothetical protein